MIAAADLNPVPSPMAVGRMLSGLQPCAAPIGFVGSAAEVKSFIWNMNPYKVMNLLWAAASSCGVDVQSL